MVRIVIWGRILVQGQLIGMSYDITATANHFGRTAYLCREGNDQGLTMEKIAEAADAVLVENTPISDNCVKQVKSQIWPTDAALAHTKPLNAYNDVMNRPIQPVPHP